jgi:hypothetical protein
MRHRIAVSQDHAGCKHKGSSVDACPCGRAAVKVLAGETDCPDASKQSGSAERVARLHQYPAVWSTAPILLLFCLQPA